ncbi:MAG: magnesium-translocating P-type ATPase [Candidatus Sericytochromatia bacterium]
MIENFWAISNENIIKTLNSDIKGLSEKQADYNIHKFGKNSLSKKEEESKILLFFNQFKSPIIMILIIASIISYFLDDSTDTYIIMSIVLLSGFLGFWQEKGATEAVKDLISLVEVKTTVIRDNKEKDILLENTVQGDIVKLSAGDMIPGDCKLIDSKDLFVNEATLTGETYPVEKENINLEVNTILSKRKNSLFMGTHIISGNATAIIVNTGKETEIGNISEHIKIKNSETEFERGIRHFGYLLMEITLILVVLIFAGNVFFHKPIIDSFLFSLALSVGLTPQLLPVIISVNLSHGAKTMAKEKVIVKKLPAIENLGSMNILCSDKTGTLTQGTVKVKEVIDISASENKKALLYTYINSVFQTGYINPIDSALKEYNLDINDYKKVDELPYDFNRKMLSILTDHNEKRIMITKGALKNILEICNKINVSDEVKDISEYKQKIQNIYSDKSSQGFRVLGIAYKEINESYEKLIKEENNMIFIGFLILEDPLKENIEETIQELSKIGVSLKMITGDNKFVASNLGKNLKLNVNEIITGQDLNRMSDEALARKINNIDIFAEIEPNQKERIVLAFRKNKNVTGYIGDGINDVSALHASDVGISVDSAVDVAKQNADIVMLEHDLRILIKGVIEGRKTFNNTLKYIFMATSANFGNMFSMAGASLFLPFLPLLPKQILLTNLLTDLPEITIATDNVDYETIEKPKKWDINFIKKFMVVFGLISSLFDYTTFFILIFILKAGTEEFRTGWFIESVVSASVIVLVIRTQKSIFNSKPSKYLLISTLSIVLITFILPFTPIAHLLGFTKIPINFIFTVILIVLSYIITAEFAKKIFYKKI